MKKNNYIVLCIAIILSGFLLWLWYALHFDHVDAPLDLVLSVIWWVLIAAACYLIHRVEKKRQERLRTCFVSETGVFNPEAGSKQVAGLDAAADCIQELIESLKYGFSFEDLPDDQKFLAVVRSKKFEVKKQEQAQGEKENGEAQETQEAQKEVEWEGEVAVVDQPDADPMPFASKEELQQILSKLAAAA